MQLLKIIVFVRKSYHVGSCIPVSVRMVLNEDLFVIFAVLPQCLAITGKLFVDSNLKPVWLIIPVDERRFNSLTTNLRYLGWKNGRKSI